MSSMLNRLTIALMMVALAVPALAGEIAIPGTGDGVVILTAIGKSFTAQSGAAVRVPKSIGSGGGIKVVGTGKAQIARVARKIKEKEQHYGLTYVDFARVPTVFFVNRNLPLTGLTSAQVLDIFAGKVTNWSEVGGPDQKILVLRREEGDSSLKNLRKTFPGFSEIFLTKKAVLLSKTPFMVKAVQNEQGTIGFGPLDVAVANGLRALKIDGKAPTDPGYPAYGMLGLVFKSEGLQDDVRKFVEFATSKGAHESIRKSGGIPL